jgi:hypothetical protein
MANGSGKITRDMQAEIGKIKSGGHERCDGWKKNF